ncbi:MAG: hypothetical protein GY784_09645 [Gammaproteobacteria bacterium]|nr:hypothetical protein [Gammaproteobacteria bacterium]MCP5012764.1 hypothetical protein [Aestuariibacter sp.]
MTSEVSFVDDSVELAHFAMIKKIRDLAVANGWTLLRFDDSGTDHEVILMGPGYTGTEEIYVGFRTYQSIGADYYNLLAGAFTGYVSGNSFDTQPNARLSGVPAHNQRIDYWLTVNPQRIALGMKVGTPVYEHAYVGKAFANGRPTQYPYPLVCAGMLTGAAATRFSDTAHQMPYKGSNARLGLLFNSGWIQPEAWPWNALYITSASGPNQIRPAVTNYPTLKVQLLNASGMYGWLDGIEMIPGFNNVVENTFTRDGDTWVVLQDVSRTGFNDYIAMRLDS